MKAKKYALSMIAVYMAYLTHGIQALIFSQNKVNFAIQWGFDMSDPESAAYAAGVAAVSTAIAWTGFGKFCSVWIGGEISDRVGRKKLMIGGAVLYVICFITMLKTGNATLAAFAGFLAGVATSGFWDASGYPAVQEAYPAAPGAALIGIKFFVSLLMSMTMRRRLLQLPTARAPMRSKLRSRPLRTACSSSPALSQNSALTSMLSCAWQSCTAHSSIPRLSARLTPD